MLNDSKLFKPTGSRQTGRSGDTVLIKSDTSPEKKRRRILQILFIILLLVCYIATAVAQTGTSGTFTAESTFEATIKDAVKFSELPEIKDSVKRIKDIPYSITSTPMFPKYAVEPVNPAKMKNEPLSKLYHSIIKAGCGIFYLTPYGEAWISSDRSREMVYGLHYKHLSSTGKLDNVGTSNFSDNEAEVYTKKFYKKHTLSGDFNYKRNAVHFYGYDADINTVKESDTKQYYQLFEPVIRLRSHYTDSSKINHDIKLSYYNLADNYNASENNIRLNTALNTFLNKENFHVNVLADYYNHRKPADTLNDFIFSLNPYFEANGKKWHADLGLTATVDAFDTKTKFYFYPQLNVFYDFYESLIIPYAGLSGGLKKNSFRSLSNENPFIDPNVNYANTNTKYKVFGGLRGNLSSNTSYDAGVSYSQLDSLHFFVIDYNTIVDLHNKFRVVYDNATLLNVSGQVKYQYKEKINFIAKGNYYLYKTETLTRAYHKPDYDLTFSALYNLRSKIIIRGDIFVIGNQWALSQVQDSTASYSLQPKLLNSLVDVNLGAEYRYSKMLSFFVNFNNIANMRYYRWERYPSQRFNMMIGLSFVPF
jgi:hypothetical protein